MLVAVLSRQGIKSENHSQGVGIRSYKSFVIMYEDAV